MAIIFLQLLQPQPRQQMHPAESSSAILNSCLVFTFQTCFFARSFAPMNPRHRMSKNGELSEAWCPGVANAEGDFVPITSDRVPWDKVVNSLKGPPSDGTACP